MMDLSVIIVSYNTKDLLRNCLNSLFEHTPGDLQTEVFVVDNASLDSSTQMIKKEFLRVKLFASQENLGFAKASNQALRHSQGKYCLFLNPDTVILPHSISVMIDFMEKNRNIAVASCKVVLPSGKLDKGCKRGFPTPWKSMCRFLFLDRLFPKTKLFGGYHLTYLDENQIHEVDSVKGAYMLVRKKAIDEVGMFDEDYWMYGEDLDWCYRFKQKGWKVVYNPEAQCIHYEGVSSGMKKNSQHLTKASFETRARTIRAFHESMHIFYNKHYEDRYPWVVNKIVMLSVNIKMALALLKLRITS